MLPKSLIFLLIVYVVLLVADRRAGKQHALTQADAHKTSHKPQGREPVVNHAASWAFALSLVNPIEKKHQKQNDRV